MARRRFRYNQNRNDSLTERSYQEFVYNLSAPQISRTELIRMIRGGEDTYFELKVKLSNSEKITQGIIALANTDGGMFVFGVDDQLRVQGVDYPETVRDELARICREEIFPPIVPLIDMISFDNSKRIVVLEVIGKKRPYRNKEGKFFMRFGAEKREITREELSSWLDEIRPLRFENVPVIGATEQDIDDALVWSFAKHFEEEIDSKFSWETGDNETVTPTIAAILLFGKNERVAELLPRSVIHATRYTGENGNAQIVEKQELKGNLLSLYEQSLKFIKNYSDLTKEKPNVKKTEDSPIASRGIYQLDSICEAIANLLIHRDLVLRDITSRINIYDNYIEFINPRRTNGFVPPASRAIRYGLTQHINPQIATIFQSSAYETFYTSLPKILKETHDFSGKRSELLTNNDEFKLKIYSA
jgi:ATP-dependent DNA helicase RecG